MIECQDENKFAFTMDIGNGNLETVKVEFSDFTREIHIRCCHKQKTIEWHGEYNTDGIADYIIYIVKKMFRKSMFEKGK